MSGHDTEMTLNFSPVKVVYQQQLWLEVIDYFFVGILGNEVWGGFYAEEEAEAFLEKTIKLISDPTYPMQPYADGVRFLKFSIDIQNPTLVLPTHYRSLYYLSLEISSLSIANHFTNAEEDDVLSPLEPKPRLMQYYNNCAAISPAIDIHACSPSGKIRLTSESVSLNVAIKWPLGDVVGRVVPRWKINCVIDNLRATLRRQDYALLTHMVYDNIMEETRNMEEWVELTRLRREADAGDMAYKDTTAFSLYGYDIKNGTPTTYSFVIDIRNVELDFIEDERGKGVASIVCLDFEWSYTKPATFITTQRISSTSITLTQTTGSKEWGGFEDLLLPLPGQSLGTSRSSQSPPSASIPSVSGTRTPELLYTSVSKPDGSNVKSLYIHEACIYLVLPAWKHVKRYFTNLPPNEILTPEQAKSVVTVGGDFFRTTSLNSRVEPELSEVKAVVAPKPVFTPFEFRLLLVGARIVIPSDPSSQASTR